VRAGVEQCTDDRALQVYIRYLIGRCDRTLRGFY